MSVENPSCKKNCRKQNLTKYTELYQMPAGDIRQSAFAADDSLGGNQ